MAPPPSHVAPPLSLGCVWVRGFLTPVQAGSTQELTQLYRETWDNNYHTSLIFFVSKKKKKWVSFFAHCAVGLEDEFQFDEAKA